MTNIVYVGTSLDGYISTADGNMDWMSTVPNPEGSDLGFNQFMDGVDAVVMGRHTFETVIGFGLGWHYSKPGIVLSSTMDTPPEDFGEHVQIANGSPPEIVEQARRQGFERLYVDGGITIQRFLHYDLIDDLIITEIPILLGGGTRLFGSLENGLVFDLVGTEVLLNHLLRKHYRRARDEP